MLIGHARGRNDYGQLGLGDTDARLQPTLVDITTTHMDTGQTVPKLFSKVACGSYHTFLVEEVLF